MKERKLDPKMLRELVKKDPIGQRIIYPDTPEHLFYIEAGEAACLKEAARIEAEEKVCCTHDSCWCACHNKAEEKVYPPSGLSQEAEEKVAEQGEGLPTKALPTRSMWGDAAEVFTASDPWKRVYRALVGLNKGELVVHEKDAQCCKVCSGEYDTTKRERDTARAQLKAALAEADRLKGDHEHYKRLRELAKEMDLSRQLIASQSEANRLRGLIEDLHKSAESGR